MTAGWGPRRAPVRRGVTDPAAQIPGHTPVPAFGLGTCGHLIASHNISETTGERTSCTHVRPEGKCGCKGCRPAEETT